MPVLSGNMRYRTPADTRHATTANSNPKKTERAGRRERHQETRSRPRDAVTAGYVIEENKAGDNGDIEVEDKTATAFLCL
mmetsp:Transcript_42807/g.72886  ORF Transcript_42807/g.72886 Transcript_42807/m.72886 type:complete len:80 (-) Transcript_42807:74-313(-)